MDTQVPASSSLGIPLRRHVSDPSLNSAKTEDELRQSVTGLFSQVPLNARQPFTLTF